MHDWHPINQCKRPRQPHSDRLAAKLAIVATEIKKRRSSPSPSPTRTHERRERNRDRSRDRDTDTDTDRDGDRVPRTALPPSSMAPFGGLMPSAAAPFLTWSPILLPPFAPALFPAFYPALRSLPGFVFSQVIHYGQTTKSRPVDRLLWSKSERGEFHAHAVS